ncbi:hypothetical protein [Pseudomonas sp. UMAB-40]|uniref:hypothetical protein n=1 Tax=Pseudomonas sp. UMAB-40 TaxID=1365407 RepID=UPI001C56A5E6|nr:hypothetical protein [Pseudomonas sp. UMAB-40]
MNAQPNEDLYGFNEADLKSNPVAADETPGADTTAPRNVIEPTLRDDELRADVREPLGQKMPPELPTPEVPPVQAKHPGLTKGEKLKWGAIIGTGGAIVFGLLIYLAWGVMHPHTSPTKKQTFDFEVQRTNPKSVTSVPQLGGSEKADPSRQKRFDDVPPVTANVTADSLSVAPVRMNQEDEDEFYDNLANAAGQQPGEKVVAAVALEVKQPEHKQAVTSDQGSNAQLEAMTQEMKINSAQMARLLDALNQVNSEVAALKTQVATDSKQSAKYGAQISAISESLTAINVKNEERFKAITDVAVAAALAAVKKQGSSATGGSGKMVLVGGPKIPTKQPERNLAKESHPRAPSVIATPQIVTAKPTAVASAVSPNQSQQTVNKVPECGAKTISQNWNVKGVSTSAAYIRRTDGEGIMVRADMEVPGFGTVKSFDPNSRTVCTTSGLIVR